jgi:hypothetical protein
MSGQIEVGKWAVMYKPMPCCGDRQYQNLPFVVTEIRNQWGTCTNCRAKFFSLGVFGIGGHPRYSANIEICKRIDDLDEPTEETKELELEM